MDKIPKNSTSTKDTYCAALMSFLIFSGSPRHCTIGKEDLSRFLPQSALRAYRDPPPFPGWLLHPPLGKKEQTERKIAIPGRIWPKSNNDTCKELECFIHTKFHQIQRAVPESKLKVYASMTIFSSREPSAQMSKNKVRYVTSNSIYNCGKSGFVKRECQAEINCHYVFSTSLPRLYLHLHCVHSRSASGSTDLLWQFVFFLCVPLYLWKTYIKLHTIVSFSK